MAWASLLALLHQDSAALRLFLGVFTLALMALLLLLACDGSDEPEGGHHDDWIAWG